MVGLTAALVLATSQNTFGNGRDLTPVEIAKRLKAFGYTIKSNDSFMFAIEDGRRSEIVMGPLSFYAGRSLTPEEESEMPPNPLHFFVRYYVPRYVPRETVDRWRMSKAPDLEIGSGLDGSVSISATLDGTGADWPQVIENVRRKASLFESQMLAATDWVSDSRKRKIPKADGATVIYMLSRFDIPYLAGQWGWKRSDDQPTLPPICYQVDDRPVGVSDEDDGRLLLDTEGVVGPDIDLSTVKWAETAREPDHRVHFFKTIDPSSGITLGDLRRVIRKFAGRVRDISSPVPRPVS